MFTGEDDNENHDREGEAVNYYRDTQSTMQNDSVKPAKSLTMFAIF